MDHNDAIGCQAATRYVAGELSTEARDAFEAHFFDCAECAEEVRWEQIFAANVRANATASIVDEMMRRALTETFMEVSATRVALIDTD